MALVGFVRWERYIGISVKLEKNVSNSDQVIEELILKKKIKMS